MNLLGQFAVNHIGLIVGAVGGVAGIAAAAIKGVEPAVEWGVKKAATDPKWGPKLLKFRTEIEDVFDAADQGVHKGLDAAAGQGPTTPPSAQ